MTSKTLIAALALSLAANAAFAKGHDQGGTEVPGQGVESTVRGAQGLGTKVGGRPEGKGVGGFDTPIAGAGR